MSWYLLRNIVLQLLFTFHVTDVVCLSWPYDLYNKTCDGKVELTGRRHHVIHKFETVLCQQQYYKYFDTNNIRYQYKLWFWTVLGTLNGVSLSSTYPSISLTLKQYIGHKYDFSLSLLITLSSHITKKKKLEILFRPISPSSCIEIMLIFLYRIRDKNITVKEKRIDVYKMPLQKLISKRWLTVFFPFCSQDGRLVNSFCWNTLNSAWILLVFSFYHHCILSCICWGW